MSRQFSSDHPQWKPVDRCGCCGSSAATIEGDHRGIDLLRCDECNTLRFAAIRDAAQIYVDGYHDGSAEFGWDYADTSGAEYETAIGHARLEYIERYQSPGSIIDIGGGLGFFAAAAAERGWTPTLLEPVSAACDWARREFGIRTICGQLSDVPSGDDPYDVAVFCHSLEHMPDCAGALEMAADHVRPGGLVYVEVPNVGSFARRRQGDDWLGWQPGEHVYLFDPDTLTALVTRVGLDVVDFGTYVPGWEGSRPDTWAHFLGIDAPMGRITRASKAARRAAPRPRPAAAPPADTASAYEPGAAALRDLRGVRRMVYGRGLPVLAAIQNRLRQGIYARVMARVPTGR